jgi:hypothetical protein
MMTPSQYLQSTILYGQQAIPAMEQQMYEAGQQSIALTNPAGQNQLSLTTGMQAQWQQWGTYASNQPFSSSQQLPWQPQPQTTNFCSCVKCVESQTVASGQSLPLQLPTMEFLNQSGFF